MERYRYEFRCDSIRIQIFLSNKQDELKMLIHLMINCDGGMRGEIPAKENGQLRRAGRLHQIIQLNFKLKGVIYKIIW